VAKAYWGLETLGTAVERAAAWELKAGNGWSQVGLAWMVIAAGALCCGKPVKKTSHQEARM